VPPPWRRVWLKAADKAVEMTAAVLIGADHLAGVVDAVDKGAARPHVDGGVGAARAAAVEKAMGMIAGVIIVADDLARIVDALRRGAEIAGKRILQGNFEDSVEEEAVGDAGTSL
jgi:hypothetical protein